MEKVERMKKKGDFNKQKLAELGLAEFDTEEVSPDRNNKTIEADEVSEGEAKPPLIID